MKKIVKSSIFKKYIKNLNLDQELHNCVMALLYHNGKIHFHLDHLLIECNEPIFCNGAKLFNFLMIDYDFYQQVKVACEEFGYFQEDLFYTKFVVCPHKTRQVLYKDLY